MCEVTLSDIFSVYAQHMYYRPKVRKMLVTVARTSTPGSHDVHNGVVLMPNLTPVTSGDTVRRSAGMAAKTTCDVLRITDEEELCLPR